MAEAPNGRELAWLLAAKAACCGALVLAATGVLSLGGLAGWLADGGYVWFAIAGLAGAALYLWWRHRAKRRLSREQHERATAPRGATS